MIVRKHTDVKIEEVRMDGATGVTKRVLVSEADGAPNFIMRQFILQPGGNTPYHTHDFEHVIYVLSGHGHARQSNGTADLGAGSVLLVLPNEEHGFVNTGNEPMVFLCSIPR